MSVIPSYNKTSQRCCGCAREAWQSMRTVQTFVFLIYILIAALDTSMTEMVFISTKFTFF